MKTAIFSENETILENVGTALSASKLPIVTGYVFGSYITGHPTRTSDVDIAVLFPVNTTSMKRFSMRLKLISILESALKKTVDLVVLNDIKSVFFKFIIISEGKKCLIADEDLMADFELTVMNDYIDFKPFLDSYNDHYVQKHAS